MKLYRMLHVFYKAANPRGFLVCRLLIDNRVFCCVDEDVEKVIGLLLRDAGDQLNDKVRNYFSSDVETRQPLGSCYKTVCNQFI